VSPAATTGARKGIVCFSAQDWWYFSHAHSDFQLMRRLAEEQPVLFVNSTGLRMPVPGRSSQPLRRVVRKLRSTAKLLRRPDPDLPLLSVLSPVFVPAYGSTLGRSLLARAVAAQVRLACRRIGITDPAYFVTLPTAAEVLPLLPPGPVLFNRSDRHSEFGEADSTWVAANEHRLLAAADRVLYVSSALLEDEAASTGERATFLDHGVDVDHFRRVETDRWPADVAGLPRPIIGYFGSFDDYLVDFELLERVAREVPEATLLLIGPATCSMRRFERHPNVVWLGARPYDDLPAYGSAFDVALMPFLDNQWVRYANPIKMKEYLALGLAVVSTDFAEVHRYAEVIGIAHSPEEFVALARRASTGAAPGSPATRRALVADATWADRARQLSRLVDEARRGRLARDRTRETAGWSRDHPAVVDEPSSPAARVQMWKL
jgi:glycosyltransferase involved in cell wall biosynthesis